MIVITTVGQETIDAIKLGYTTNVTIAEYLSKHLGTKITPQNIGSRVSRLRKQGLVIGKRSHANVNLPLVYILMDLEYVINDSLLKKRTANTVVPKTYAGRGEMVFNNLNSYLYPKKLCTELETMT